LLPWRLTVIYGGINMDSIEQQIVHAAQVAAWECRRDREPTAQRVPFFVGMMRGAQLAMPTFAYEATYETVMTVLKQ